VDEHSIVVARYESGLSKMETRWGTFTDPWNHQPQPKCGFVIVGTEGTVSCSDYAPTVRLQTRHQPERTKVFCDGLKPPEHTPIEYMVHCITTGTPLSGPLSPAISRIGQQIVDSAVLSAREKRTVALLG
jgi:predicted dehydrogenase